MSERKYTDIEAMLVASADGFLSSHHSLARSRLLRRGQITDTTTVWRLMAECGWLSMSLSESCGGAGLGVGSAAELAVRLGEALLPEPFAECAIAPAAILSSVSDVPAAAELMEGLVLGTSRPAIAWQTEPGQLEPTWNSCIKELAGKWEVQGRFEGIDSEATHWIVASMLGNEPVLFIVHADVNGCQRQLQKHTDGSSSACISFDSITIDELDILVRGSMAKELLIGALNDAQLVQTAYLAGVASAALVSTIAYLQQRVQFNRPISSFQAIRHRVVDLEIQRRLAFASWRHARVLREAQCSNAPQVAYAISAAKARCSETALLITRTAIQLHGAIGYTEEADIGLFLSTALKHASRLGNASLHRSRMMRQTLLHPATAITPFIEA